WRARNDDGALEGSVSWIDARRGGQLFDVSVEFVDTTTTFTGVMGPSAENTTVHTIGFEVGPSTIGLKGVLNWQPFADLDFRLLDPSGNEVASAASLDTPEVIEFDVGEAGTYTWVVDGYVSVLTEYTLDSTQTEVRIVE
ncbi:MAG: hypothetical protein RQ847_04140, partial [Wenzhouxiangellaceae bacterium]|nr:hypothetical protein [Wenzhouxiangellaceae bacterium]